VFLDGAHRGVAPLRLESIEPGSHTVLIADEPFYQAVTRRLTLKPREAGRLQVRLPSKIEALYRGRIQKQPKKLASYVELLHHYLEAGKGEEAVVLTTQALRMLDGAEASDLEHAQFQGQLNTVCRWRAPWVGEAAREDLFGTLLARFGALAARQPNAPASYLPIAHILARTKRLDKLLAACDDVAKRVPAASAVHVHIAQAWLSQGELALAIAVLQHATALRPDSFQAHGLLGLAYHRAERYDDSLREYQAAEKLSASAPAPLRSRLHVQMARLLADKGDMAGAAARYEKALGLDTQAAKLTDGLIVHYPFDKDASDASGKGHHGEAHGAEAQAGGRLGGAFKFDGAKAYVGIPAAATKGLSASTFALWLKTTHTSTSERRSYWSHPALVGVASGGYGSGDLAVMVRGGNVAYFHGLTADGSDMSWASSVAVADDKWHHIALVNAGSMVLVYVDGKLAQGEGYTTGAGTRRMGVVLDTSSGGAFGEAALLVGACNASFGRMRPACFYRGLIDDLRIWNRPLRSTEIAALAKGP
jgi:tetratricopeptide (TPR) repeat protein